MDPDVKTAFILRHVFDLAARARAAELVARAPEVLGEEADDFITNENNFHFRRSLLSLSLESQELHEQVMVYLTQLDHNVI